MNKQQRNQKNISETETKVAKTSKTSGQNNSKQKSTNNKGKVSVVNTITKKRV